MQWKGMGIGAATGLNNDSKFEDQLSLEYTDTKGSASEPPRGNQQLENNSKICSPY